MTLFDNVWLNDDIINIYLELLVQDDQRFQIISSDTMTWELNRLKSLDQSHSDINLALETRTLLIPTFVNGNHWILCVARFGANDHEGLFDWYKSSSGV